MNRNKFFFVLLALLSVAVISCNKEDEIDEPSDQIDVPDGYSLVWSDEFNDASINTANWQYEKGDGTDYGLPAGWGNDELQIYTESSENSGITEDGDVSALYITALSDGAGGYTSAKLNTKNLFSMHFGRVEVKAKMAKGQGVWPAIWMLGDNRNEIDWPGCGEIDIAEVIGHEPEKMYGTLHYTDSENSKGEIQESYSLSGESFNDSYHVFSVDWTPETITFSVDDVSVQEVTIEDDMKEFLRSFYLIMNVAVGGHWPGEPDNTTSFPQTMYVDYVRVFEKDGFEAPEAPALDIDEESIGQNIEPSLAQHAIKDAFEDLGNATVVVYGAGGEPVIGTSDVAIDGDSSLVLDFPGGNWGGGYIELQSPIDISSYTTFNFSIKAPATLTDAEIKLESSSTNFAVYLKDYSGTDVGSEFIEYSIPLADFTDLNLTELTIAFSMWNPKDENDEFLVGTVLLDNLYFSN